MPDISQSVLKQLKKRLIIRSPRDNPRAGMVIFNDEESDPYLLLIKEKGGGKRWGFPKGGVEYRCETCGLLVRKNEYMQKLKENCPKSSHNNNEKHHLVTETVQECAERETLEEIGLVLDEHDRIIATRRVGNCTYMIVKSLKKVTIKICSKELTDFRWVPFNSFKKEVEKNPYTFNFGARNIVSSLSRLFHPIE